MVRKTWAAAAIALGATAVLAQSDPIASRKALERANDEQHKIGTAMVTGQLPFDLDRARIVFATFLDVAGKAPHLFPENSKTGGDTSAAARIWDDPDGFRAAYVRFATDAKTAQDGIRDPATFRALFEGVTRHCGACHEIFRVLKT